jgi:hypothetical protein
MPPKCWRCLCQSVVVCWGFLERLPLLAIVIKDDQRHVFALHHIEELLRAGAQLLFVVIIRPSLTIKRKKGAAS